MMKTQLLDFVRRPSFWIIYFLIFVACSLLALQLYPKAFPIVDIQIQMDRKNALKSASFLSGQQHWGPFPFQQAISFDVDSETQTFVELAAGGTDAFKEILKESFYSPYTWKVRHFFEGKTEETFIRFTPKGEFYGFLEKIPENAPGKALSVQVAQQIAEKSANRDWKIDLSAYHLVEKSQEERPSHRMDHTFVYERTGKAIGDGQYRLKLVVAGDRLVELSRFIKIPDAFFRRYAEMRSANNTIATIATVAMVLLYLMIGCGFGIFYLARKHWIIWKTPLLCGFVVASFQVLEQINQMPLIWMHYDTALSSASFLARSVLVAVLTFLGEFVLLSVSFMAAESLSRRAFPSHPQLWRIWKKENAASIQILGRTLGGYLSTGFFFAFVVCIYILGRTLFGWWNPTDILFHPDGLATYFPWFTSVSNSLHAGFWEESLFRAVPLAGAALIGTYFGRRKLGLTLGFIIQILIFAAAHANYPTQPSYARVVELIIPSTLFGGIYLLFGLLPGIILHYTFDVISFAIPIFSASTPGIWIDRLLVILISLCPLWLILIARLRVGRWTLLPESELNQGWQPQEQKVASSAAIPHEKPIVISPFLTRFFPVLAGVLLAFWVIVFPSKNAFPPLEVSRENAIQISKQALEKTGVHLSSHWEVLAHLSSTEPDEEDAFVWQEDGAETFQKLMGSYLPAPGWEVRFVRFDVPVEERAEEYQVFVSKKGEVFRIRHEIPEGRAGKSLSQDEARKVALSAIQQDYQLGKNVLREVSSNASKLPARTDWLFIFQDQITHLKKGETRVGARVSGDQVTSTKQFIFIPEDWLRAERSRENQIGMVKTICGLVFGLIFLGGVIAAIISWSQKKFSAIAFLKAFSLLFILGTLQIANVFPAKLAHFSTEEPRLNQIISVASFGALKILALALFTALLVGYLHHKSKPTFFRWTVSIPLGYAVGVLLTIGMGALFHFFPKLSPTWGSVAPLDSVIPVFSGLFSVTNFIATTLLFCLISHVAQWITTSWTRNRFLGALFLVMIGFSTTGVFMESISSWLISGFVLGIFIFLIHRYLIRSAMSLIPLMVGSSMIVAEFKQIKLYPYAGALPVGLATIAVILLASLLWHRNLNQS